MMETRRHFIFTGSHNMSSQADMAVQTVGVVLVNWNGAGFTIPCIESLLAGSVKPDLIVVVDNASRDNSSELISQKFPGIELIRNKENLGFTGANNIGISRLMAAGCEYIWILNNDTTVDGECLSTLKSHMAGHLDVSACSGKILYADPDRCLWYAGARYNKWILGFAHRGQGEEDAGQYDRIEEVPFLSGCCMFVRREAIERVGLFDDHFFAYYEDSDWCLRAREARLRLDYIPEAVIRHKVSATVNTLQKQKYGGTTTPFSVYITNRNRLYLLRKHAGSALQSCSALLAFAAWVCYYSAALLLLFRIDKCRALVMAVYDGITNPLDSSPGSTMTPRYLS